jgi:hypothetical protein
VRAGRRQRLGREGEDIRQQRCNKHVLDGSMSKGCDRWDKRETGTVRRAAPLIEGGRHRGGVAIAAGEGNRSGH